MPQSSGFDPTIKVKTCFDCKIFDVANWVACLNGENYPGWTPSHEALSVGTKGLWSDREKRLHINVLELKAVSLALQRFKDQNQNQTVLVATANSTVVAYINKQGGAQSAEMCALLWKIMTWCHRYQITLQARHIPIWEMVQRKLSGFLNSFCEKSLRLFHVPVPRSKQVPLDHWWLQNSHCWHLGPSGALYFSKLRP